MRAVSCTLPGATSEILMDGRWRGCSCVADDADAVSDDWDCAAPLSSSFSLLLLMLVLLTLAFIFFGTTRLLRPLRPTLGMAHNRCAAAFPFAGRSTLPLCADACA